MENTTPNSTVTSKREQLKQYQEQKRAVKLHKNEDRKGSKKACKSKLSNVCNKVQCPRNLGCTVQLAKIKVPEFKMTSSTSFASKNYTKDELQQKIIEVAAVLNNLSDGANSDERIQQARAIMESLQTDQMFINVKYDSLYWLAWLKLESEVGNYQFCKTLHKRALNTLKSESSKKALSTAYKMFVCNNNCDIPTGLVHRRIENILDKPNNISSTKLGGLQDISQFKDVDVANIRQLFCQQNIEESYRTL